MPYGSVRGKLVHAFKINGRGYRLVRYVVTSGGNREPGYVVEEQAEDAMGIMFWQRTEMFTPDSPVASMLRQFVDTDFKENQ